MVNALLFWDRSLSERWPLGEKPAKAGTPNSTKFLSQSDRGEW